MHVRMISAGVDYERTMNFFKASFSIRIIVVPLARAHTLNNCLCLHLLKQSKL